MQKLKGLYVIADAMNSSHSELISKTEEVLLAGARIIQYRDKVNSATDKLAIATQLSSLTHQHESLFIVNDNIELTLSSQADGVHLGKHDASIEQARIQLGDNKIIGASCYANYTNAKPAVAASADYIAFGSFFPSPTKPNAAQADLKLLSQAKQDFDIPICAIGGITTENAEQLMDAGADMIAVISSVFNASSPTRAVQEYLSLM